VVAYYQQIGRAGRALPAAHVVLLSGQEEMDITDYFIESAFPSRDEVAEVLAGLQAAPGGLSINELMKSVNASLGRIEKALQLLSLESPAPIVKQGSKWILTAAKLTEAFWQRADRLTALRRAERQQMQEYAGLKNGHMEFLVRALDGDPGRIQTPNFAPLSATTEEGLVREAAAFPRRTSLPIEPRKKWPPGGLASLDLRGNTNIAPERNMQPGKALCVWGDAGWGELVRRGKYHDRRFADDLVSACAALMRQWSPQPPPTWVTFIPSRRHPSLVPDFARRLAAALNLRFHGVLEKTDDRPEQKTMANSSQQARNIDGSLAVRMKVLPPEPVLLVDDMVDSKWTLTIAAYLLTSHGSGPVYPLALAATARTG